MKRLIDRLFRRFGYIRLDQSVVKIKEVHFNAMDIRHEIRIDQQDFMVPQGAAQAFMERCKRELEDGLLEKLKEHIEFNYVKSGCDYYDIYAARIFIAKKQN